MTQRAEHISCPARSTKHGAAVWSRPLRHVPAVRRHGTPEAVISGHAAGVGRLRALVCLLLERKRLCGNHGCVALWRECPLGRELKALGVVEKTLSSARQFDLDLCRPCRGEAHLSRCYEYRLGFGRLCPCCP